MVLNALTVAAVFVDGEMIKPYAVFSVVYSDPIAVASPVVRPYVAGDAVMRVEKFCAHATKFALRAGMYGASDGMLLLLGFHRTLLLSTECVKQFDG